jgi:hypothetical protein
LSVPVLRRAIRSATPSPVLADENTQDKDAAEQGDFQAPYTGREYSSVLGSRTDDLGHFP